MAAVVLQSQAVFTVVGAVVVLRERPGRAQLAGIGLAVAGLGVLAVDASARLDLDGFVLGLGAGASWAVGNLVARGSGTTQGLGLVVWGSVVAAPPLAVLALLTGDGPGGAVAAVRGMGWSGSAALGYLVVFATVLGFGTWSALIGRYPAASVAPFTMLVPPIGLAAAWVALGERVSPLAALGSAGVVGGLLWPSLAARLARGRVLPVPADQKVT
jgi:O-acetylserine/cysteine efflux transporter